ncbi:hypothetical protein LshimejAT787_0702550 [Lyophyllum shimeji]|uniref:DUF7587 domain-containing protein n=1 Tax=Lyophyllum shimeji TaxID=47721 RepID=A0A9P3UQ37_LYOSH|nr:hypothetical protein LshimejAT787_0702550 [Lyophyllum shimeji]
MASSSPHHKSAASLPQYGFGADVDFDSLVKDNHFLFRVYTPKEPSPFADDSEPFFVAPKFNERFVRSPAETDVLFGHDNHVSHAGTYEDVARHMDWTTKASSPYLSTSFSFIWSIWEALRRYHLGIKKDVEIAVIDASALSGRAVTAVQLLRQGLPSERRSEHWKWYRYAQESQSVLVYEYIPATAIFSSIPLISLLEKLPSYFLRQSLSDSTRGSALATIGWDYTEKKRNYRQFCQDMSNRFLQSTPEARLTDTTAGSVRLAMAFLRSWFHRCVVEDFQTATITLYALAFSIAQWPGQWWAQEHSELWDLIRATVLSIAEEVRSTQGDQTSKEIIRLQCVIGGLEEAVERYKGQVEARERKKPAHLLSPLLIPPPLRPATMPTSPSPFVLAPPSGVCSGQRAIVTPITPPTSPIRFTAPKLSPHPLDHPAQTPLPASPTASSSSIGSDRTQEGMLASDDEPSSPTQSLSSTVVEFAEPLVETQFPAESDLVSTLVKPPSASSSPPPAEVASEAPDLDLPSLPSPLDPCDSHIDFDNLLPFPARVVDEEERPIHIFDMQTTRSERTAQRKPPTIAETASCLVTGFLVGAFITLCLMSPQRRTLLTHLT